MMKDYAQERREAFVAGNNAIASLERAKEKLKKARGWGIVDILGGGFVSSLLKKERMEETKECLDRAFRDVQLFRSELGDLDLERFPDIRTDDFLITADWLFDNTFVDIAVQGRLEETARSIDRTIAQIDSILPSLY